MLLMRSPPLPPVLSNAADVLLADVVAPYPAQNASIDVFASKDARLLYVAFDIPVGMGIAELGVIAASVSINQASSKTITK